MKSKILILGGCARRDYLLLGGLHHLITLDILSDVHTIVTGSSTCQIALLLTLGYTPIEISLFYQDLTKFIFEDKVRSILDGKDIPTLGQLEEMFNMKLFFSIYDGDYISTVDNPEMSCLEAIRLSTDSLTDSFLFNPYPIPCPPIPGINEEEAILGLFVTDDLATLSEQLPLLGYISRLTRVPRNELIKRTVRESEYFYKNLKHISLKFDDQDQDQIFQLFIKGRSQVENILSTTSQAEDEEARDQKKKLTGDEKDGDSGNSDHNKGKEAPEIVVDSFVVIGDDQNSDNATNDDTGKENPEGDVGNK